MCTVIQEPGTFMAVKTVYNTSPRGSSTLTRPLQTPGMHKIHIHMGRQDAHTHKVGRKNAALKYILYYQKTNL